MLSTPVVFLVFSLVIVLTTVTSTEIYFQLVESFLEYHAHSSSNFRYSLEFIFRINSRLIMVNFIFSFFVFFFCSLTDTTLYFFLDKYCVAYPPSNFPSIL